MSLEWSQSRSRIFEDAWAATESTSDAPIRRLTAASFDRLPRDIVSNIERFGPGPALGNQSRNLFGSGQKCPFGQFLNLNAICEFHSV